MCNLIQRILYFSLLDCSPYNGYHCQISRDEATHSPVVSLAISTLCTANKVELGYTQTRAVFSNLGTSPYLAINLWANDRATYPTAASL